MLEVNKIQAIGLERQILDGISRWDIYLDTRYQDFERFID